MTPHLTVPDRPVFFTSDHHFGHKNIGRTCARPHLDHTLMDAEMIDRWNSVVPADGHVFHLGDFSLDMPPAEQTRPHLNGTITLIAGNHERWWDGRTNRKRARTMQNRARRVFDEIVPSGRAVITINGTVILLSHLPYHGDSHLDERYANFRPIDTGLPLICGHVHNTWATLHGGDGRLHRGQLNVGVDVWDFTPVPMNTALDLLEVHR